MATKKTSPKGKSTKRTKASNPPPGGAAKPRRKREGLSGLDAAALVLSKSKEPLNAKTIAERAIAAGWKTSGKTPHSTLYAAMVREISTKGKASRFAKFGKGQFTAAA
ncbi:MAG: winged helix-turn-helix domain-containing protein [Phycisphaerales bacterium]|nr:winged helix-turn-helix domain-containing protein [Phycisphaerales bacterium]